MLLSLGWELEAGRTDPAAVQTPAGCSAMPALPGQVAGLSQGSPSAESGSDTCRGVFLRVPIGLGAGIMPGKWEPVTQHLMLH